MSWVIKEKWLWIIIAILIAIMVLPYIILTLLIALPPELSFVATILLVISWGVVSGYKEWIISKRKEKEQEKT